MRICSGEDGMRGAYSGREPGGIEMKTKMNLARGGASASKKLLAAIAVLAVAFAVFAAIPVAVDDSEAATEPVYYDATIEKDDATASTYKTLQGAINAAGENGTVILKTDVKDTEATVGIFTISKAVTIKSANSNDKKVLNFGISTNKSLTLQDVVLSPTVNKVALSVNGIDAVIDVEKCIINVNGGTTDTVRGDGIIISKAASVTFKNNTFNNVTSGHYVRAMFISNVSGNVDIDTNTAAGFHVFAALHAVSTGTVEGKVAVTTVHNNTSTGMTGDFQIKSGETVTETKDSKFLQIAGAGSNVVVKDNTVSAKAGVDAIPYVNIHDSAVSVASLTVDKDLKVTGNLTITGTVQVEGQITLATLTGSKVIVTSVAINNNTMLVANGGLVGDKNATIANAGTFVNNGAITCSDKTGNVGYSGAGTFVAGAKSTATMNIDTGAGPFVGTGSVTGKTLATTATVNGTTPITIINKYLEEGLDVTGVDTTLGDKDDITVVPGSSITGTVKVSSTDSVKFNEAKGDFTVYKGNSIHVCGAIYDGSEIEGTAGDIYVTGTITGNVEIKKNGGNVFLGSSDESLTIASGAKVTLSGAGILVKGDLYIYGTLTSYVDSYELKAEKYGTPEVTPSVKAYNGASIYKVTISGTGSIDLSQAQNPQNVGEDISYGKEYGQLENVTIVGSLTIKNNSTVKVYGGFNVNEGVTLTIENGSTLEINSNVASMIVDGRIVVEEGGELIVTKAKDVKVSGSIESEGTVDIASKVTVKSGGSIVIKDATVGGTEAAPEYASIGNEQTRFSLR